MSGGAAPPTRRPSRPFEATDSSSSYSYDSSSRSSSVSSSSSSEFSSNSSIRRRRGRRRLRSRSPVLADNAHQHQRQRMDAVLDYDSGPVLPTYAAQPSVLGGGGVLDTPERPAGDWACGVCSNINSHERDGCYRCGCFYTEGLLATPCYEVCVMGLPPGVPAGVVEQAVRQTLPEDTAAHVSHDAATSLPFVQFPSVEEATRYLVGQRCEVAVTEARRARLGFALLPHARPKEEDAAAAVAQAKAASTLLAAGVPRFLWPETWRPPTSFPSVEKQRAFLGTMSAHWEHLSEDQRRYYESEVRKALLKSTAPEAVTPSPHFLVPADKSVTAAAAAVAAVAAVAASPFATPQSTTVAATSPSTAESPLKGGSAATSHALDGLKKRLAERKLALKKTETAAGASSGASPSTTTTTASAAHTPGGASTTGSNSGSGGLFPASPPSAGLSVVQTWGGFPVPLQYATLADVPRTMELARVPMSVCERLLPPALLQVVRMQFR